MIERFLRRLKKSARASLIGAIKGLSDEEAREVIREAKPGYCLSRIGSRKRKKGALDDYAKAMIAEAEKEVESNAE